MNYIRSTGADLAWIARLQALASAAPERGQRTTPMPGTAYRAPPKPRPEDLPSEAALRDMSVEMGGYGDGGRVEDGSVLLDPIDPAAGRRIVLRGAEAGRARSGEFHFDFSIPRGYRLVGTTHRHNNEFDAKGAGRIALDRRNQLPSDVDIGELLDMTQAHGAQGVGIRGADGSHHVVFRSGRHVYGYTLSGTPRRGREGGVIWLPSPFEGRQGRHSITQQVIRQSPTIQRGARTGLLTPSVGSVHPSFSSH